MMIETALKFDKPVRIGVNWGSLDQALLTATDGPQCRIGIADRCARRDA